MLLSSTRHAHVRGTNNIIVFEVAPDCPDLCEVVYYGNVDFLQNPSATQNFRPQVPGTPACLHSLQIPEPVCKPETCPYPNVQGAIEIPVLTKSQLCLSASSYSTSSPPGADMLSASRDNSSSLGSSPSATMSTAMSFAAVPPPPPPPLSGSDGASCCQQPRPLSPSPH